ncbi:S24 family peptidase [Pseudomonas sp. PDM07]|jgi:phage repressor protein C with HTH and peptisase S24 domain|uniref:LexA family transcriptional regulator n=1 Tax=Pseudomonas sp. PDM07 TaxID=2769264 RepID=UPI00177F504D|nr:S24 family peptidase [Pseudomonas sp. PDM07]MBD9616055.1 helix-turn-helix transcriptional regulator [Pseudomonas sp. PDM07]
MKTRLISNNAERFVKALELTNTGGAELARVLGLENDQNITNWKKRGVPANKISAVALALGLRREWLEYGDLPMFTDEAEIVYGFTDDGESYEMTSVVPSSPDNSIEKDDLVFFLADQSGAPLDSSQVATHGAHKRRVTLDRATLKECGVKADNAVFMLNVGNSNHPLLPHGAVVGIDKAFTRIVDSELYALTHNGSLRVRFLQRLSSGAIRQKCFNFEEYPDKEYSMDQVLEQRIVILGRVFWWSVSRPLGSA